VKDIKLWNQEIQIKINTHTHTHMHPQTQQETKDLLYVELKYNIYKYKKIAADFSSKIMQSRI
jgi:hypothetical protein